MRRPFAVIGLTLFFVTAFLFEFEIGVAATAFVVFAVALVVSLLIKNIRKHGFLPLFFASAAVASALLISTVNFIYLPVISYSGMMNCDIKAEITDFPELKYGKSYYESNVISVNGEEADFKIRLVFSTPPEAEPYDIIEGKFNLYALGESDEDIMKSYKSQGVFLGGYPVNDNYTVKIIPENEKPLAKKILDIRASIKNSVYKTLPDDKGDLAVALIIGDTEGLSDEIYSDFKEIGISHVICVSGFHLSLWSMLILNILKKTGVKRWIADILAATSVLFLMLVAGLTYSVIRAGIMMLVFLVGDIIMRRRDSLNSLGFAMAYLSITNPFAMGSVSLKLSALATLGIILYNEFISPQITKKLHKIKNSPLRKIISSAVSALMITVSATAFTLPMSLTLYGSFNYLCFISNLIIVPVAGWSMVVCSAGAFIGTFSPDIFNLFSNVGNLMLEFIINSASHLAEYDFLTFRINEEKTVVLLGGLFVFCLLTVFVSYLKKPVYGLAAVLCAAIFTVSIVTFSNAEREETKITVVDCGNGLSVLVNCNGENMLVGCGGTDFFGLMRINDAISSTGSGIDTAVVPDSQEKSSAYANDVFSLHKPERVFYDELPEGAQLLLYNSKKGFFSSLSASENIYAKSVIVNDCYCVLTETDDVSALICFDSDFNYSDLPEEFKCTDIIISRSNFPEGSIKCNSTLYVLSAEKIRSDIIGNYLNQNGIECEATGNGSIVLRAKDGKLSAALKEE